MLKFDSSANQPTRSLQNDRGESSLHIEETLKRKITYPPLIRFLLNYMVANHHFNINAMKDFLPNELSKEFEALIQDSNVGIEKKVLFWQKISGFISASENFDGLYEVWQRLFKDEKIPIAWTPGEDEMVNSNIGRLMKELKFQSYQELYKWSVSDKADFWKRTIEKLDIKFQKNYTEILDIKNGVEDPIWLKGAEMNIVESCFNAVSEKFAIIQESEESDQRKTLTYNQLHRLVNRIASGLIHEGFKPGDKIVIYMPFTIESIATYLAIVKAGLVVVSVADSFSANELRKRIEMTEAKAVLTCDAYLYNGKKLNIISKAIEANAPRLIVCNYHVSSDLRKDKNDILFEDLLKDESFSAYITSPDTTTNILFSSGTTKEPKSIPWTHLTPIKCAADGLYHQNIQPDDVVTWTTGMGWMMAPWLIYASFINKATMAIYTGAATTEKFGRFVEEIKINILGTIPSVVKVWRSYDFIKKFNWNISVLSSTGEPSNVEDYFYLMALTKFKAPVIEYCGGTEIGGGYITGTVVQPASPASFTTPALGIDFYLLNNDHKIAKPSEPGEVFIVPPSIGLTQELLNKDHHKEYYEDVPSGPKGEILRKHGDAFEVSEVLGTTFYKSAGRIDDSMNLGGIKISAIEIEETLTKHPLIFETAAISVPSDKGGPEKLIVYYVLKGKGQTENLLKELQQIITNDLNPLFRISEIIEIKTMPRTASNKLMRRELRKEYLEKRIQN